MTTKTQERRFLKGGRHQAGEPTKLLPLWPILNITGLTRSGLAATLHLDRRQLQRWALSGMTFAQADAVATRLGLHPLEVWGDFHTLTEPELAR